MKRLLILTLLTLLPALPTTARAAAAGPPNIVMIVSDDQAWTDYGFMGHPQIKTPYLDRLASQSLTFRRGYVPASLCCPSLASMITGLYPHQHKVTSNDPPIPAGMNNRDFQKSPAFDQGREIMSQFIENVPTLPRALQQKGYVSLQTGKWWQKHYSHGGFTSGMTQGGRHGDAGLDIGRKTMQPIYDFIDTAKKDQKPFFVWYAPMMPHDPHTPPDRILEKYKAMTNSIHVARYWAMCEWFDETCGDLLGHLDKNGLSDNTIIVFLADNGWIQNPDNTKYAPKSKQSQYDGGTRTPIMIRWPGKVKPVMSDDLAISIDLMPTLLKAAGLPTTKDVQGIDLLDSKSVKARKTLYGECFTHNSVDLQNPAASLRWRWVIDDQWKLIVPTARNEPDAKIELYNLEKDPFELTNLADKESGRVTGLQKKLDGWWPGK
ncbi:MAG TPA: sulfatase [Roseimicrobium sp.]|nr:sulfatase [Roseimicrobium sp.]